MPRHRAQEQHLFDRKFAVMPVAADHAVARLDVIGHQQFGMGDQRADAGGVGFQLRQRVGQHFGAGGVVPGLGVMRGELHDGRQQMLAVGRVAGLDAPRAG